MKNPSTDHPLFLHADAPLGLVAVLLESKIGMPQKSF
jgi:hypothetical protein